MSLFKAALAVAAVAAAGYATYKVAKKYPKATNAVVEGLAAAGSARSTVHTETVVVVEEPVVTKPVVIVREEEAVWEADKSKMEGVMSVAKHVQDHDNELTVGVEDGSVVVTHTRHVAKELEYLDVPGSARRNGRMPLNNASFPSMTRH